MSPRICVIIQLAAANANARTQDAQIGCAPDSKDYFDLARGLNSNGAAPATAQPFAQLGISQSYSAASAG